MAGNTMNAQSIEPYIHKDAEDTVLVAAAGRSGQTWLCFMLAHLLNARFIEPYCLARGIVYSGHQSVLELTQGALPGRATTPYTLVVKTHEHPDPYYSLTSKVIVIVRDPRDVITSASLRFYVMKTTGSDVEEDAQGLLLTDRPLPKRNSLKDRLWKLVYGNQTLGIIMTARKWARFHAAWRRVPFAHVIRYEDLLVEPLSTMAGICSYLEVPMNPAQIKDTLHQLSFKQLTGRCSGVEQVKNLSFRKGVVGDHKNKLKPFELSLISYFCKCEAANYGYNL
jgi:hypothetical protein